MIEAQANEPKAPVTKPVGDYDKRGRLVAPPPPPPPPRTQPQPGTTGTGGKKR